MKGGKKFLVKFACFFSERAAQRMVVMLASRLLSPTGYGEVKYNKNGLGIPGQHSKYEKLHPSFLL